MEISLKPNDSVFPAFAAKTLKILGLSLVLWAVAQVCLQKLEYLKQNKIGLDANYVTAAEKTKQLECLTKNIYWEAASEPFEGKVGVAQVTMNRVESGKFASSVCGVVYQKNVFYEKVVCQFSWYCENVSKIRPIHKEMWKESEEVAKKVLLENFRLPSLKNALYYHADYVNPGWQKPKIDKIGRHIFYGEKNAI
jgi:spore germination cell wall hydrolase CwlJ-like protein